MIKIWGKLTVDDKVIKGVVVDIDEKSCSFFDMLQQVSHRLNIPTPVLLDKHVYDFNLFHISVFRPDDFVESVNFEKFVLELMKETN